jgi:hypothetical protein
MLLCSLGTATRHPSPEPGMKTDLLCADAVHTFLLFTAKLFHTRYDYSEGYRAAIDLSVKEM